MENYQLISDLGRGAHGTVYLVQDVKSKQNYALKKIECSDEITANTALKEIISLKFQNYGFIPKYHQVFISWDTKIPAVFLCIVTEYFPQGDIGKLLQTHLMDRQPLDNVTLQKWVGQLIQAIFYLHKSHVIHKNLKPSNIFLKDDGSIAVGDIGLGSLLTEPNVKKSLTENGDLVWVSPELKESAVYDERNDIWSLGCIILEMACCGHLNVDQMAVSLYQLKIDSDVLDGLLEYISKNYSSELSSLIHSMLRRNIYQRPTALELCDNPFAMESLRLCGSDLCHEILAPSNDEDQLLVSLMKVKNSSDSQVSILKQLVTLITRENIIFKPSTRQYVVDIMTKHPLQKDILTLGLKILYLTHDNDTECCNDVIGLAFDAIKAYTDNADVLLVATELLMILSMQEPARDYIVNTPVLSMLLRSLKQFSERVDMLTSYCVLFLNLSSNEDIVSCAVMDGIIELVCKALKSHMNNNTLVNSVVSVLFFLSTLEYTTSLILGCGAPELLLEAMATHEEDSDIVKFSCSALRSLCETRGDIVYYIVDPKMRVHGLKCIIRALKKHSESIDIAKCISGLLQVMINYDDITHELAVIDTTEVLSSTLGKLREDEELKPVLRHVLMVMMKAK